MSFDFLKNWRNRKPDDPAVIAALLKAPIDAAHEKQEEARILSQREKIEQRARIIEQRRREMPALEAAEKATGKEEERCRQAYERSKQDHVAASLNRLGTALEYDRRIAAIDSETAALDPAIIDETIAELAKELEKTRLKVQMREGKSEPNWLGIRKDIFVTNVASSEARVQAIREAIEYARSLKLQPLPMEEIVELLKAAVQKLPAVVDDERGIDSPDNALWHPLIT
jgi:hypothetical protein